MRIAPALVPSRTLPLVQEGDTGLEAQNSARVSAHSVGRGPDLGVKLPPRALVYGVMSRSCDLSRGGKAATAGGSMLSQGRQMLRSLTGTSLGVRVSERMNERGCESREPAIYSAVTSERHSRRTVEPSGGSWLSPNSTFPAPPQFSSDVV